MNNCSVSPSGEPHRARVPNLARSLACCALALQLGSAFPMIADTPVTPKAAPSADPVLEIMKAELNRATAELAKSEQSPNYVSYTVYDQSFVVLVGAYGS